jgi:glycosyltransferase involved in cell wall biosynthesis
MNQAWIHGDPFQEDAAASLLRSFLRLAVGSGLRCALAPGGLRSRGPAPGDSEVLLPDGARTRRIGTRLPPAEIELLVRAAGESVAATAPVVVFTPPHERADGQRLAGLERPLAAAVIVARDGDTAADLLQRLRAELRWAGAENPPHALEERELAPWPSLPPADSRGPIVHVGTADRASGTDLVVDCWLRHHVALGRGLRLVLVDAEDGAVQALRRRISGSGGDCEIVRGAFEPEHVRGAAAIVLPWRQPRDPRLLVQALASGRPVCASRTAATAALLGGPGTCHPIGGRLVPAEPGVPEHFAPDPRALATAMRLALGDEAAGLAMGRAARRHVVEELTRARPSAPPAPLSAARPTRPVVVLEAPFFESSPRAAVAIGTAQALHRRGLVELRLVPRAPFAGGLARLRRQAPALEALLCRDPADADLWLSSLPHPRATRPACRTLALAVDCEFGALPLESTPHVTQEADVVVVPSEQARRTVAAAGRPLDRILVLPPGVDERMHGDALPDPEIVAWKRGRPAVLFCGAPTWRDGFDHFLQAALAARAAGADFCIVAMRRFHDECDLPVRCRELEGTPPLLVIDRELSGEERASVHAACDVLLQPCRADGAAPAVLEARACGLPVLATATAEVEPLLQDACAVRIPSARRSAGLPAAHVSMPCVHEALADEAGRLLAEMLAALEPLRRQARDAAGAVRQDHSWDAAASAIERLAAEACGRRAGPAPRTEPIVVLPSATRSPESVPAPARG